MKPSGPYSHGLAILEKRAYRVTKIIFAVVHER